MDTNSTIVSPSVRTESKMREIHIRDAAAYRARGEYARARIAAAHAGACTRRMKAAARAIAK